jgi:hypothetical protein
MKLVRFGGQGQERPGVIDQQGRVPPFLRAYRARSTSRIALPKADVWHCDEEMIDDL